MMSKGYAFLILLILSNIITMCYCQYGCEKSYSDYCVNNVNKFLEIKRQKGLSCEKMCNVALRGLRKSCYCDQYYHGVGYSYMHCWKTDSKQCYDRHVPYDINEMGRMFLYEGVNAINDYYNNYDSVYQMVIGNSRAEYGNFKSKKKYERCECSKYKG